MIARILLSIDKGAFRLMQKLRVCLASVLERNRRVDLDRHVERDLHRQALDVFLPAGHRAVGALDPHRHDRRAGLVRDLREPGGEPEERSVLRTAAFGEDREVIAVAQTVGPALQAVARLALPLEGVGVEEELDDGHTMAPMGLESLVNLTMSLLPEAQQRAFVAAQKADLELKKQRSRMIVASAAVSAAGVAATAVFTVTP